MTARISSVVDVVRWRMCIGCGACASICPDDTIRLVDVQSEGIRPKVVSPQSPEARQACLDVCPAYELDYTSHNARPGIQRALLPLFGPVLDIWEGHARDPEIRHSGSSGGALTALGLYCIDTLGMAGVLHTGGDPDDPVRNKTTLSKNRSDLLSKTGSRYAPASVCDGLRLIEDAPAPCAFVGQPGEVAALRKACEMRPLLGQKLGLALSFFCAGSPATQGTRDLLKQMGVNPADLGSLRYRGNGWPGMFAPSLRGEPKPAAEMTYAQSWAFLQKYRPYSVHLWPDDTGEAADISCGDPWYQQPRPGDPGSSLVLARTELGRRVLRGAVESGYLELTPAEPWKLATSQQNLSRKRRAVAGRRLAFRLFGIPVNRLRGFRLFRLWLGLSPKEQAKSLFGTMRRIYRRRYFRPLSAGALQAEP